MGASGLPTLHMRKETNTFLETQCAQFVPNTTQWTCPKNVVIINNLIDKTLCTDVYGIWNCKIGGPGSSVIIATDYGLDGPGSNPGGDEIFRPSRPALGPTQPPVHWVPALSRG